MTIASSTRAKPTRKVARHRPMNAAHDDTIAIDAFLTEEGFTGDALRLGRQALEEAGLTRPGKTGFSAVKLEPARAILAGFARVCERPECRALVPDDGRRLVTVPRPNCEVCGGSNNAAGVRRMVVACTDAGLRRVLVVGGTPNQWDELGALLAGDPLELRFVDGTRATNERAALQDCAWADLVIVWAPTPLAHRVSDLYAADRCVADRVEVHRRGIEALATAVADHLVAAPGRRAGRSD